MNGEYKNSYCMSFVSLITCYFISSLLTLLTSYFAMWVSKDINVVEWRREGCKLGSIAILFVCMAAQYFQFDNYKYLVKSKIEKDTREKRLYLYLSSSVFLIASFVEGIYLLFIY